MKANVGDAKSIFFFGQSVPMILREIPNIYDYKKTKKIASEEREENEKTTDDVFLTNI